MRTICNPNKRVNIKDNDDSSFIDNEISSAGLGNPNLN